MRSGAIMEGKYKSDIQEVLRQARKSDKEDQERIELFQTLLRNPAFKAYQELLGHKLESLGALLLMPSGSLDGLVTTEWQKGAMYGLVLARDVVSVTVQIADEARKAQPADELGDDE